MPRYQSPNNRRQTKSCMCWKFGMNPDTPFVLGGLLMIILSFGMGFGLFTRDSIISRSGPLLFAFLAILTLIVSRGLQKWLLNPLSLLLPKKNKKH